MGTIKLTNIRTFSHHGCLPEETKIGSEYRVDLEVKANLDLACKSDELNDTVDYVLLNRIVKEEMAIPSKLLETVANRIMKRVFNESLQVSAISVCVSKVNPPIGGDVEMVSVLLEQTRS
ncbi:MAG: dihydroneopterin aldolase [Chitinophagaceae bacterium]|nr:MAG: dihydroneopterin aldolase [Chitinophagaceae bacterium]